MYQRPHQVLLQEFAELIINYRSQFKPSQLKYSSILNLWQIKGDVQILFKHDRAEIAYYLQKMNQKILVEVWVLEAIKSNEFTDIESLNKKGQRLNLILSRSILSTLSNSPLNHVEWQGKYKLIYQINEGVEIPKTFTTLNYPLIPIAYDKVTLIQIRLHFSKEIVLQKQITIVPKEVKKRKYSDFDETFQRFRGRIRHSLQIQETIEYFDIQF